MACWRGCNGKRLTEEGEILFCTQQGLDFKIRSPFFFPRPIEGPLEYSSFHWLRKENETWANKFLGLVFTRSGSNGPVPKVQQIGYAFTRDQMEPNPFGSAIRTQTGSLSKAILFRSDPTRLHESFLRLDPNEIAFKSDPVRVWIADPNGFRSVRSLVNARPIRYSLGADQFGPDLV